MHNIALLDPELQELDGLPKAIQSKFSLSFPALEIRGRSFSDLIKFMEFREDAVFITYQLELLQRAEELFRIA